jgi:hypothetical protein
MAAVITFIFPLFQHCTLGEIRAENFSLVFIVCQNNSSYIWACRKGQDLVLCPLEKGVWGKLSMFHAIKDMASTSVHILASFAVRLAM